MLTLERFSLGCVLGPTVGAKLVFALLTTVSRSGDHKDRPYRGRMQLRAALEGGGTSLRLLWMTQQGSVSTSCERGWNGGVIRLDAPLVLLYPAAMADFYDPFSHHHDDGRSRRPEVSKILPSLFVGEYPRVEDVAWLKQEFGISAVLSLQDTQDLEAKSLSLPALEAEYRQRQIEFRRTPVADFDCYSLAAALPAALDELRALTQNGHTVFLHCNAGCNRAPTLAIAYLHRYHDMALDEARDFVKAQRPCGPYMEVLYQYFGRPEGSGLG